MRKAIIRSIIEKYLNEFPNEKDRLSTFISYLDVNDDEAICDWNNINGHITAGGFVYSISTKKYLVMYHKDLDMYLYPGGHLESNDLNPLERAKIEAKEETGLKLSNLKIFTDELVPIDIDTHKIPYNPRVNMPEHLHFDFRYVFVANNEEDVKIDGDEMGSYKWIDKDELSKDVNYGNIVEKLDKYCLRGFYE